VTSRHGPDRAGDKFVNVYADGLAVFVYDNQFDWLHRARLSYRIRIRPKGLT